MTREEAIKVLENASIEPTWGGSFRATSEALDMAIEALSEETPTIQEKHQLSEETSTNTPTKSTNISTNTPIEALKLTFENDTEIKSCSKDSDLISRAEAIEAIELVDWYHQNSNKDMVHGANDDEHQAWYKADDVYKALEAVPSADRPRGEWIDENGTYYANCSKCGYQMDTHQERGYFRFCPSCGADMRGEDE